MSSPTTDFLRARTHIAGKIQKLEAELKYWQDELKAFDRVETTMRRLMPEANQEAHFKLEAPVGNGASVPVLEAAKLNLNEFLSAPPKKRGELIRQIY